MLKNPSKIPRSGSTRADDFRNLMSSLLFTDTAVVRFSRRWDQ